MREAKKAARLGDFSRAGDLCDLAGHPVEAIEYYVQGKHYLLAGQLAARLGDHAEAAGYFSRGGDPALAAETYLKAGQKKRASEMYAQARQYLKAAEIEEKMTNHLAAAAFYEMGGQVEQAAHLFARAGDSSRAADLYERLIQTTRTDSIDTDRLNIEESRRRASRYSRFAGILYMKSGQFSKAGPYLEQAGLLDQAVEAYRKAGAVEQAVTLLIRIGNHADALKTVEDQPGVRLDPALLGELYLRSGGFERAAEVFLEGGLNFKAAECFESSGNLARAASLFAAEGEMSRAADLHAGIGQHEKAAQCYESACEFTRAGEEYEKAKLAEDAVRAYASAGRMLEVARIHLDKGSRSQAIRVLQQVQRDDRDFSGAARMLGSLFFEQGLYSPAAERLETALKFATGENDKLNCMYRLALAYEQLDRGEEARKLYERILTVDYHHADVAERLKSLAQQIAHQQGNSTARSRKVATGAQQRGPGAAPGAAPDISGRLEVIRKLGEGRHAVVLEAYDRVLQRKIAAKRYPVSSPEGSDMIDRFQREAHRASQLSHPNMVTVFGIGEDGEGRYILEELVEGRSLREILADKIRLDPSRVVEMATQICDLLSYAHGKGLVHRDLRPENIFILPHNQVKVSDFGLKARFTDASAVDGGAICYASPEAIRSERTDERSDIYAVGVILYETLLGEPPFPADTASFDHLNLAPAFPAKVDRHLPRFLRKIITKCMEKERGARYQTASQVLDELRASAIVPGVVIADRYEIVRELGIGGMGRIYQALDRDLEEVVALKVLRATDGDRRQIERFLREVKTARRISHPNVVKVYDLGSWKEHKYITMEYIDGMNLEQWVRLRSKVDHASALRLIIDVARGVESAHSIGIIHRDIKPQNILLKDGSMPKILDFGIAQTTGSTELTTAGFVMGSPKYMSPEQVQAQPLDARSDIYSLGVLMYFVFTGREPFVGDTPTVIAHKHIGEPPRPPREINPAIPNWLNDVILKAMEKERDKRHSTMRELVAVLEARMESAAARG